MKLFLAAMLLVAPVAYGQRANRGNSVDAVVPGAHSELDWIDAFPYRSDAVAPSAQPVKPVSVNDLRIPAKALKEWQRSESSLKAGDVEGSNRHLENAVKIYPDFFAAHFDLGGNHMRAGEYEKGLAEYQQAARINPNVWYGYHGVSIALLFLKRYADAEAPARHALELDPECVDCRYILARTIVAEGRVTPEAIQLLHQSEEKFPNASLVLAQLFLDGGRVDDVVEELRMFLRAPDAKNKGAAECWLALLNGVATGSCAANKTFPDFQ